MPQEATIIQQKWYIQNRAKTGKTGISQLHEKVSELSSERTDINPSTPVQAFLVKWRQGYSTLSPESKKHAWFTDGSAKYVGQVRYWKAVPYNPSTRVTLESSGQGGSSQLAELIAVHMAIKTEKGKECHIFTDS